MAAPAAAAAEGKAFHQFRWPVQVYYEDTDAHGIVYHGSYVRFFDRARTEWLRASGVDMQRLAADDGLLFVVRSLQIAYNKSVQYGAMLELVLRVVSRSRSSVLLEQKIFADGSDDCVCEAEVRVVCIGSADRRPKPLPPQIEEFFQQ